MSTNTLDEASTDADHRFEGLRRFTYHWLHVPQAAALRQSSEFTVQRGPVQVNTVGVQLNRVHTRACSPAIGNLHRQLF